MRARAYLPLLALLATPLPAARAQFIKPEADFYRQLGDFNRMIQRDIRQSRMMRKRSGELTKEDAVRMVLANLTGSGVPEYFVREAFDDPATRLYPDIPDRFKRGGSPEDEDYEKYRKYFITEARVNAGVEFLKTHHDLLGAVQGARQVDPGILTSLLGVETFYGTKTGAYQVFSALYTIVLKVPSRSDWAAKELAEWLKLCRGEGLPPHRIKGSYAGAFGYYQFIPSSFNRFAVDFDGDGRRSFDSWPDVLGSVANYLRLAGFKGDDYSKGSPNWKALYAYNHHENYVRVLIDLRQEILRRILRA